MMYMKRRDRVLLSHKVSIEILIHCHQRIFWLLIWLDFLMKQHLLPQILDLLIRAREHLAQFHDPHLQACIVGQDVFNKV